MEIIGFHSESELMTFKNNICHINSLGRIQVHSLKLKLR